MVTFTLFMDTMHGTGDLGNLYVYLNLLFHVLDSGASVCIYIHVYKYIDVYLNQLVLVLG